MRKQHSFIPIVLLLFTGLILTCLGCRNWMLILFIDVHVLPLPRVHGPDFDYKWVGVKKGNVKAKYGDNSLFISGIENEGAREEYAHTIIHIQMDIDKESGGDVKEHSHEQSQDHEHGEGEEHEHQ